MDQENVFRIAMALLFFSALSISAFFRYKADRDSGEKVSVKDEGALLFILLRMGGLLLWLSVAAYIINPAWMSWSKAGIPDVIRWMGAFVGLLCVLLLFWMFRSIGSGITPTVATRTGHKLVKAGPYHYVRHPLYSIATTLFLSFGLLADNWFFAVMAVLAFILLAVRLPNEEAHLVEKFGDEYREYMKTTGAFLPRFRN